MRRLSLATLLALAVILSGYSATAVPITQPTGLNPGDEYRLVFVTSTTRDATSSDIADYNAFVTAAANSSPEFAALGTTWTAIASTATVDARDNTNSNYTISLGVPIYSVEDILVATNNADLWDGEIGIPIQMDQYGVYSPTPYTWTGTEPTGVGRIGYELGTSNPQQGWSWQNDLGRWICRGCGDTQNFLGTQEFSLYAISGVLVAVPEPSTASLLALGLIGLAAKRRRSN